MYLLFRPFESPGLEFENNLSFQNLIEFERPREDCLTIEEESLSTKLFVNVPQKYFSFLCTAWTVKDVQIIIRQFRNFV